MFLLSKVPESIKEDGFLSWGLLKLETPSEQILLLES